jgi:hypothetical protein
MKGERFMSLPVLGVLSLILFVYYTKIFIFLGCQKCKLFHIPINGCLCFPLFLFWVVVIIGVTIVMSHVYGFWEFHSFWVWMFEDMDWMFLWLFLFFSYVSYVIFWMLRASYILKKLRNRSKGGWIWRVRLKWTAY